MNAQAQARKAAIVLVSIDSEAAGGVLAAMGREEAATVLREVAALEDVTREERDEALREFEANLSKTAEAGGVAKARELAEKALSKEEAERLVGRLEREAARQGPFAFVEGLDSEDVARFLEDERVQTVAVLLAHLPSARSAAILEGFPEARRAEIARRLGEMKAIEPAAVAAIAKGLEAKLAPLAGGAYVKAGGPDAVARILKDADPETERRILEVLSESDPGLAERVTERMFTFEEVVLVEDRGMAEVAREVDRKDLVAALAGASEAVRDKFFRNLSPRVVADLRDEVSFRGAVPRHEVEQARRRVVEAVRRLEADGRVLVIRR